MRVWSNLTIEVPTVKVIYDKDTKLVGETIVCIARKVGKPQQFDNSSKHRSNRVVMDGTDRDPVEAYIHKKWRAVRDDTILPR